MAPLGGILESENCIKAHISAAQKYGAEALWNTKVDTWEANKDGTVTVRDTTGVQHVAQKIVLCVGCWSSQLVPELKGYLQPERQVVAWFEVQPSCVYVCVFAYIEANVNTVSTSTDHIQPATVPKIIALSMDVDMYVYLLTSR